MKFATNTEQSQGGATAQPAGRNGFRRWLKLLPPLVGITLMSYLVYRAGPARIGASFLGAKFAYLGPAFLGYVAYLMLQTLRWRMLLSAQSIHVSYPRLFLIYLTGMFYGLITPGRAGNLVKAVYIKQLSGAPLVRCANSVVLERLLDLLVILILASIGATAYLPLDAFFRIAGGALGLVLLVGIALLFGNARFSAWFVRSIPIPLPGALLRARVREALAVFFQATPHFRQMIVPLLVTCGSWVVLYSAGYLVLAALSAKVPWPACIVLLPIGTAVALIPITVGGWGTREVALAALFEQFNVGLSTVISYSLIAYIIGSIVPALAGFAFALFLGRSSSPTPARAGYDTASSPNSPTEGEQQ